MFIVSTIFVMLVASRLVVRIVDATVQIDRDLWLLVVLLLALNAGIVFLSRRLYGKTSSS